jgi:hypothetical protein
MTISGVGVDEQLTFKIDQEISLQMDVILCKMQQMARDFKISEADKKSPFKNILSVAVEPLSSLEIIKTYIRYQVGRQGASPIWKKSINKKLFAAAVVEQIDDLSEDAQVILEKVISSFAENHPLVCHIEQVRETLTKTLHLRLAQLYLGYLSREHTALVGYAKETE